MSVTSLHMLYKKEFEPIVLELENVAIADSLNDSEWIYGKVMYIEPLEEKTINLGPIGAADKDNYPTPYPTKRLDSIKLNDNEFAQYRITVADDFLLEVRQPAAIPKFADKEGPTRIPKSEGEDSNFAEIFVWEDNVPTVRPYAVLFKELSAARIKVKGFRYVIQPLMSKPREYTVIPVCGITRGVST